MSSYQAISDSSVRKGLVFSAFSFCFYCGSHISVMFIVWEVLEAIVGHFTALFFPRRLRDASRIGGRVQPNLGWCFCGIVVAGDGVVFRMQTPPKEAVDGDVSSFFTQKVTTLMKCCISGGIYSRTRYKDKYKLGKMYCRQ